MQVSPLPQSRSWRKETTMKIVLMVAGILLLLAGLI